jgi:hypothetical protein
LDKKYNSLKDEIFILTKTFEDEKFNKENPKSKQNEDIKKIEMKFKNMLAEEKQVFIKLKLFMLVYSTIYRRKF